MASIHSHLIPVKLWAVEKSNVMARLRFQRENSIPTVTEIRENLGPNLGNVFMQKLNKTTKALMHLDKNLDGPGHNLWTSPSEQLMGHLTLKKRRQNQALTHEMILRLGEECMLNKEKEMADKCNKIIEENDARLTEQFAKEMEINLNVIRAQEREDYLLRIALMESRLHAKYEAQVKKLEATLKAEADARVKGAVELLKKAMDQNITNLLDQKEKMLTQQFHFQLKWISSDLYEDYRNKLNLEKKKMLQTTEAEEVKKNETETEKKMILEGENTNKIMCAILLTKRIVEDEWKKRITTKEDDLKKVEEQNKVLTNQINETVEENNRLIKERKKWECVTKEVLRQFEKFVAYALKLPLMQSTYLLSFQELVKQKDIETEEGGQIEVSQKILKEPSKEEIKEESEESIICYKEIASIVSSLIHRAVPSPTPSEDIVGAIMSEIIRNIVYSRQESVPEEVKSNSDPCASIPMQEITIPCIDQSFTKEAPLEFLNDRVSSVLKILNKYPALKNQILHAKT